MKGSKKMKTALAAAMAALTLGFGAVSVAGASTVLGVPSSPPPNFNMSVPPIVGVEVSPPVVAPPVAPTTTTTTTTTTPTSRHQAASNGDHITTTCPDDGSVFAYGSCQLPAQVPAPVSHDGAVRNGAPSSLVTICGVQVVRPAGYTVDENDIVCDTTTSTTAP